MTTHTLLSAQQAAKLMHYGLLLDTVNQLIDQEKIANAPNNRQPSSEKHNLDEQLNQLLASRAHLFKDSTQYYDIIDILTEIDTLQIAQQDIDSFLDECATPHPTLNQEHHNIQQKITRLQRQKLKLISQALTPMLLQRFVH